MFLQLNQQQLLMVTRQLKMFKQLLSQQITMRIVRSLALGCLAEMLKLTVAQVLKKKL